MCLRAANRKQSTFPFGMVPPAFATTLQPKMGVLQSKERPKTPATCVIPSQGRPCLLEWLNSDMSALHNASHTFSPPQFTLEAFQVPANTQNDLRPRVLGRFRPSDRPQNRLSMLLPAGSGALPKDCFYDFWSPNMSTCLHVATNISPERATTHLGTDAGPPCYS